MTTLDVAKATINFEIWESAQAVENPTSVTLVNGHTRSLTDFRMMGRALNAAGFRVIVLDNRGSGKTKTEFGFTVDDMVEDVVAIWDHVGISQSYVLGISMGGFIAQVLACRFPSRVRKLVLVSTSAGRAYLRNSEQGWVTNAVGIEAKMASYFTPDFIARNRLLFEAMVKQTQKSVSEGDFLARAEAQRDAIQNFEAPRLESIGSETLVVHGALDDIVDIEGGKELSRRIPKARFYEMADAGHLLLAEKPKELYDQVIEFFLSR